MAEDHVSDSVHKECLTGELPRKTLQYLLFCDWLQTFFSPSICQHERNGQGDDCEILIPVHSSRMPEVRKFISREILKERTRQPQRGVKERGLERRKDGEGAHESAFARKQQLNSLDFVLCKPLFNAGTHIQYSLSLSSSDKCAGNKRISERWHFSFVVK